MEELIILFKEASDIVQAQYDEALEKPFAVGEYFVKPKFMDNHYADLYVGLKDDLIQSVKVGLYDGDMVYRTYTFDLEDFTPIYQAVSAKYLELGQHAQELKAELSQLQTSENPIPRLTEIINTRNF